MNKSAMNKIDMTKLEPQVAENLARIDNYLKGVDFGRFVAELMDGVYHTIVASSIEQMEAYGQLVEEISKTIEEFMPEKVGTDDRRYLIERFDDGSVTGKSRQQLLATMILLGLNGIVMTYAEQRTDTTLQQRCN
jgi:predicted translin family RNA/ssDNA-binding protein